MDQDEQTSAVIEKEKNESFHVENTPDKSNDHVDSNGSADSSHSQSETKVGHMESTNEKDVQQPNIDEQHLTIEETSPEVASKVQTVSEPPSNIEPLVEQTTNVKTDLEQCSYAQVVKNESCNQVQPPSKEAVVPEVHGQVHTQISEPGPQTETQTERKTKIEESLSSPLPVSSNSLPPPYYEFEDKDKEKFINELIGLDKKENDKDIEPSTNEPTSPSLPGQPSDTNSQEEPPQHLNETTDNTSHPNEDESKQTETKLGKQPEEKENQVESAEEKIEVLAETEEPSITPQKELDKSVTLPSKTKLTIIIPPNDDTTSHDSNKVNGQDNSNSVAERNGKNNNKKDKKQRAKPKTLWGRIKKRFTSLSCACVTPYEPPENLKVRKNCNKL